MATSLLKPCMDNKKSGLGTGHLVLLCLRALQPLNYPSHKSKMSHHFTCLKGKKKTVKLRKKKKSEARYIIKIESFLPQKKLGKYYQCNLFQNTRFF